MGLARSYKVASSTVAAALLCSLHSNLPAQAAVDDASATVIRNVNIVDVQQGAVVHGRDVLVREGVIASIVAEGSLIYSEQAHVVDGSGLYLMPGLFDAHVHITAGQETFQPLLLAHGVVAVRDTGAPTDMILQMRRDAMQRGAVSPELIVTGAIVDGDPPVWPFSEACDTPEQAIASVDRLADAGVDQIKVYSLLKADVYKAAVAQARKRGLTVTGHVPHAVSLQDAIAAGHQCIEHFEGFGALLLTLTPNGNDEPRQRGGMFAAYNGWLHYDHADQDALREDLRELANADVMQCPTISVWRGILQVLDDAKDDDPRLKYVPQGLRDFWSRPQYGAFAQVVERALPAKYKLLGEMHSAGVPLMIGTDLGNPYVFAGWAVHDEMRHFNEAGIPTAEVLRMATIVPARFCGVDDRLGTIEVGKQASMVLVRENPLENVANAREIETVFLRGRMFDREGIDGLLALAESRATTAHQPADAEITFDLPGEEEFRGRFVMKFEQWDAGTEHFLITHHHDGWHVAAHVAPAGPGQVPSYTTLHFGHDGSFISGTWKQLATTPIEATYTIENGQLVARSPRGDGNEDVLRIDLPADFVIGAPILAADVVTKPMLHLAPGEKRELSFVAFGFPSWQPTTYTGTVERLEDETLNFGDENNPLEVRVERYDTDLRTPMGQMQSSQLYDKTGMMRRSAFRMGYGQLTVEYVAD